MGLMVPFGRKACHRGLDHLLCPYSGGAVWRGRAVGQGVCPGRCGPAGAAWALAPEVRRLGGKRRNTGPGDILTLHHAPHGRLSENVADLLAARSLIYVKLIKKDELLPGDSNAPHSEDEASVNRVVDRLSIEDCRALFGKMRLAKGESAHQVLTAYLAQSSRK